MAEVNGMRIAVLKRTATAKVTGIVRGFQHQSEFTIPTQVEEKGMTFRVTEIDDAAFRNCSALTSITIPEGIVRIGKLAFAECSSLTSITIPKTVTQIESGRVDIGENVYYGHLFTNSPCLTSIVVEEGNPRYKSIQNGNGIIDKTTNTLIAGDQTTIIPEEVTSIGGCAFYDCDTLTSVTIPNSVTSIGDSAFRNCDKLTSITIPDSVTSIGNEAFAGCNKLTSVTIGNSANNIIGADLGASPSLTSINVDVNNPNYCSIDGVLFDKNQTTLIRYPRSKQGAYIIPDSVWSIGDHAFYDCEALTSITIPNSVASIRESAFLACSSLTSITIPDSVTSIGVYAFAKCKNLTSIIIANGNTVYDSRKNCNAIIETSSNTLVVGCQSTIIPNSVRSIGNSAFSSCSSLSSLVIPDSVTSIESHAFRDCSSLSSVVIPDSVTSIGEWAFAGCSSLTSVTIPNSVTSIGECAFRDYSYYSGGCWYKCIMNLISVTIENEKGKVAINGAFPYHAKITYVGKPKEQPAKPAEKEIAQAKPEAPKANTPTNPSVVIDLEKLMAAALIDGVVTDKERAILIKKVKEAGGDVDEFEMLLDARIHEAQQKQIQQEATKPIEKEMQQTKSQPTPEVRKAEGSFIDRIKNFFK